MTGRSVLPSLRQGAGRDATRIGIISRFMEAEQLKAG